MPKKSRRVDSLTSRQYEFVKHYIKNGFNAKQACLSAGYSEGTSNTMGSKLLNNPVIKAMLGRSLERAEDKLLITFEYKLSKLKRIIDQYVPDEGDIGSHEQANVVIRAIAELNKMNGDYAPDKQLRLTVDTTRGRLIDARKEYEEY